MNFHELAAEEALRVELGKLAEFSKYGRERRTPMTFVLDEVERQIGPIFSVYWVEGGPPEVFCLPGLTPSPVAFSKRYLSLTAFVRHLLVDSHLENVLEDVAKRTVLKVIAEMALRHGDPDFAVLAFTKSLVGKGIWLDDYEDIMSLEHEPIHENYMATWFYGLVHELGHLHPNQQEHFPEGHFLSDSVIAGVIGIALDNFKHYDNPVRQEAMARATQLNSKSVLAIDTLRKEGLADIFAASVLFRTTFDIMKEINDKKFDIMLHIYEMLIFLNIIALLDRCKRVATIASLTEPDRDALLENLFHPVAVTVRGLIQRQYLDSSVAIYLYGEKYTEEQFESVVKGINGVAAELRETIDKIDSSLGKAMEFSLFPERRENEWKLLDTLRQEIYDSAIPLVRMEIERFIRLADILGVGGKLLKALKGLAADPSKPISHDPIGDLVYFVPWLEGPGEFSQPFGLDTKYGHLVFVFHQQGELYEAFFGPSAENLRPGYTLKRAIVPVPRAERLGPELAAHMPGGQPFQIIVEGAEEFESLMKELAAGTIWE